MNSNMLRPGLQALPAPGEGKRGEEGHLGYLLRQANVAFRGSIERALSDLSVTLPQYIVLTMVRAYPKISNADLARLSLLTPQTVSVIVGNLKRAGMLRSEPHPIHGRIQTLGLTRDGEKILNRCRQRVAPLEERLTSTMSISEQKLIRQWLVSVAVTCTQAERK